MSKIKRVDVTENAKELIIEIAKEHGELMFYQAGGCCEGTQPMCFTKGGYFPRTNDVRIGDIMGYDFWIDRDLFEYWKYSHFTIDVLDGFGTGGFSLEIPKGKTFKVIYKLFSSEELDDLEEVEFYNS